MSLEIAEEELVKSLTALSNTLINLMNAKAVLLKAQAYSLDPAFKSGWAPTLTLDPAANESAEHPIPPEQVKVVAAAAAARDTETAPEPPPTEEGGGGTVPQSPPVTEKPAAGIPVTKASAPPPPAEEGAAPPPPPAEEGAAPPPPTDAPPPPVKTKGLGRKISKARAQEVDAKMVETVKNLGAKEVVVELLRSFGVTQVTELKAKQADELLEKLGKL